MTREEFILSATARYINEGYDLKAARLIAIQMSCFAFPPSIPFTELEADAEEERRDGWSIP
jgi:hypothetical protein